MEGKLTIKELVLILEERIISLNDSLFNCEDSGRRKVMLGSLDLNIKLLDIFK